MLLQLWVRRYLSPPNSTTCVAFREGAHYRFTTSVAELRRIAVEPRIDASTISIEADAPEVWRVLADEFLHDAASAVISSGPNPETSEGVNGSRCGGRVSDIGGLGKAGIRLVAYGAQARC